MRRLAFGVLLPGFNGTDMPQWVADAADAGLAGVLLFGHNTPSPRHAAQLTAQLRAHAPGLLISSDEEGGDVTRVEVQTGSSLPGACALGEADDVALTEEAALRQGELMRATGIDLPITPVLDVASEPANPVIGVRSFSPDPEVVARHGAATIAGLHRSGVAACAKHFPGHGDTDVDSHLSLPVLDADRELLDRRDLPPFARAIEAGVDVIMTGHLRVPALGDRPASQEPAVAALIRSMGHRGPIVTDALDMAALHDRTDSGPARTDPALVGIAAVRALAGGADLLCLGSTPGRDDAELFDAVLEAVIGALRSGELDAQALAASVARNHDLVQTLRARQERSHAPSLDEALESIGQIGARAASAAVRTEGDVRLAPQDALVDLRRGVNLAAGPRVRAILDLLTQAGLVQVASEDLPAWQREHPDRRVAVLTRNLHDGDDVLRAVPGAVVIHLGVPGAAPAAGHRVLGHGAGLANCREIVARCFE